MYRCVWVAVAGGCGGGGGGVAAKKATIAGVTRAGDQLQAQSGYALYMARVVGLLSIMGTTAAVLARARRFREIRALREAVDRELEYREVQYSTAAPLLLCCCNRIKHCTSTCCAHYYTTLLHYTLLLYVLYCHC